MKKSKIIVPALGLLLLSTAASVSGTVAWFTASRFATINTGAFAVVQTDGTLTATPYYGVGTAVSGTTVNPVDGAKLGDVSFNPATKQLWTDTGDGTAYRTIGDTDDYLTQPATNGLGTHVYKINDTTFYAYTWKITLSYTWGADFTTLNVFFDYSATGSSMTAAAQAGGTLQNETSKGLRIAMIGTSRTAVFAGLQTADNLSAVTSTSATAAYGATGATSADFSYFASTSYAKGNVLAASATAKASYVKAVDGDASQNTREDYLGSITHANATDTMDIYCVAWYEGTDPQIVNNKEMEQVTSALKFYAALNA